MKTPVLGAVGAVILALSLSCSLHAQTLTVDTAGLVQISDPPAWGTFDVLTSQGFTAPFPCPPGPDVLPDPQFFLLPTGQYLVVSASLDYTATQMAAAANLIAQSLAQASLPAPLVSEAADAVSLTSAPQSLAVPLTRGPANDFVCVTGGAVIITNFIASFDPVAGWGASFWVTGGTNGLLYDVYATPALGSPLTNAPWAWLGRTTTCSQFSASGQSNTASLYILGTPQDSGNGGLPDAYCLLILKAMPPLGYTPSSDGYGTPDAWYLAHGLNPMTPGIALQDPNGNGIPNYQEYRLGNDPLAQTPFIVWVASPNGFSGIP